MGASVILHLVAFLALQGAVGKKSLTPLKDYRVALEYPSMAESLRDDPATHNKGREGVPPEIAVDEDTIALDTKDIRYSQYADIVRERIMSKWIYPAEAKNQGLQGHVVVLFTIEKNGCLSANKISSSSSHPQLDREAQEAVRRASPFPPLSGSIKLRKLHVNADFQYSLGHREREEIGSASIPKTHSGSETR